MPRTCKLHPQQFAILVNQIRAFCLAVLDETKFIDDVYITGNYVSELLSNDDETCISQLDLVIKSEADVELLIDNLESMDLCIKCIDQFSRPECKVYHVRPKFTYFRFDQVVQLTVNIWSNRRTKAQSTSFVHELLFISVQNSSILLPFNFTNLCLFPNRLHEIGFYDIWKKMPETKFDLLQNVIEDLRKKRTFAILLSPIAYYCHSKTTVTYRTYVDRFFNVILPKFIATHKDWTIDNMIEVTPGQKFVTCDNCNTKNVLGQIEIELNSKGYPITKCKNKLCETNLFQRFFCLYMHDCNCVYKVVRSQAIVRGFLTRKKLQHKQSVKKCAICLSDLYSLYKCQKKFKCNHIFCQDCIEPWIDTCTVQNIAPRCPTCRTSLD